MKACRFLLLACLLLACLLLAGRQQAPQAQQVRPVVKTMPVSMEAGPGERAYSGAVVARHEVQESFRVDGRIARRLVDVGDRVRAGQVLATLDENDLRLSMESALAEHGAATSNRTQALTDEGRYAVLLSKGVVSRAEFEARRLAADEAKGRLDRAERALGLAKNRLDYANLVCSTDGVVTKVGAEAGQVVAPGQGIVSVAKDGELEILVDIPEGRLQSLTNAAAQASLWSSGDKRYPAVLREIAPAADPLTRTYAVRYSLHEADSSVRLGMTATLRLSDSSGVKAARIPASALFDQGDGPGVWAVAPETGRLSLRRVAVDRYTDRDAYVRGELADGDVIVVAGAYKLDRDMTVRPACSSQEAAR
ncbi:MAG: efflux RND transporter periplasmic adaptor subunit [Desulfovibrionaceae bacterium]|nr:efflux RND transporter periplasmic adaptor subunit [Desulfovibrionaceae bacterium]MBF0513987.1 efflux RND transporter periplasmic adaptor subunit [Desulfovibrionaceae bacterium]